MNKPSCYVEAKELIEAVKGKRLSLVERKDKAIELAGSILKASHSEESYQEKKIQEELSRMVEDPSGKAFTLALTDQCFRSKNSFRVADQIQFILSRLGIPTYFSLFKKWQLGFFFLVGKWFAPLLVPLLKKMIHQESSRFILPGESSALTNALESKQKQNVRINLNHLGEAILGESEANSRLELYLEDLKKPEVEYISVKISTLYSQINLIAWDQTLTVLSEKFTRLLQEAEKHSYTDSEGSLKAKFVNLDMEEYRDLHLTVALFKKVLSEPRFKTHSAGIVLQSYLPDSYALLKDLTEWALERVKVGGAPIKIRLVKGANLAMEKVDAALHNWPQAPYRLKLHVDANFKRMLNYALQNERAQAVHIGIGSHNLFDIAYSLLLRSENQLENQVTFEMLEGMADPLRRIIQKLSGSILLYCPAAKKSEFQNAVAYLVRRLDENTSEENFLRQVFKLKVHSPEWDEQVALFSKSCETIESVSEEPRREQNRHLPQEENGCCRFKNEADTDWSLKTNRLWGQAILKNWQSMQAVSIPLVIDGKAQYAGDFIQEGEGNDPSNSNKSLYKYALANKKLIDQALKTAVDTQEGWSKTSPQTRASLLLEVAQQLRNERALLAGVMVADTGKVLMESDPEISEAIDFAEYYARNLLEILHMKDLNWNSRGPTLVASPWNFPCSIPAGGIIAALAAGNTVVFKPAPEAVWVGWELVQLFWKAGISKKVLQFINCEDELEGTYLISDPRLAVVVLTGSTDTAKHFLKVRSSMHLIAETGGKNAIIVSNMADRDQAVKDIIQSAFGHAGQKCSACSLVICLKEVYEDSLFRQQLKDATESLLVGTPWNPSTRMNPLIKAPNEKLLKGLTQLEKGEFWLVEPKQNSENPCLWTPGIKMGVQLGSFTQSEELFGPVLGIMQAESLQEALQMVNQSRYGLTSGLHSLDEREQKYWAEHVLAGNCYINRGITGAIVQRQPFGGWKDSSFSPGAKAGGPNYLMQFFEISQLNLPQENEEIESKWLDKKNLLESSKQSLYMASVKNYAFYWAHYFKFSHDPSCVLGEDNFLRYRPREKLCIRLDENVELVDVLRLLAAVTITGANCCLSFKNKKFIGKVQDLKSIAETDTEFVERIKNQKIKRIRFLSKPLEKMYQDLVSVGCYITVAPVLANGRVELLHFLREQSLSIAYHRYGNLGERESTLNADCCNC